MKDFDYRNEERTLNDLKNDYISLYPESIPYVHGRYIEKVDSFIWVNLLFDRVYSVDDFGIVDVRWYFRNKSVNREMFKEFEFRYNPNTFVAESFMNDQLEHFAFEFSNASK